ncbi:MAG: hypothetical protein JNG83_04035 [Opitutaceae bacterium]|nr:hypothetical protein [Opitutaceae bacterium]
MNPRAIHPIIYVRGYAMTQTEIEETVADPYMGFNLGSSKVRQLWDGQVKKYFFESPLVRLIKPPYGYDDVYEDGVDQVVDPQAQRESVPYRSIVIYRYYEPSSKDLGAGEKPNIERFARGLGELILRVRARMFPEGRKPTKAERDAGKPASADDFRVYLVAHSMGGLVCRGFLQNPALDPGNARRFVDKVFTYATPHNGIDVAGVGNIPDWLSLYGINTFNRERIAELLALKKADRDGDAVDTVTNFDFDRVFNLVGTNPADYKVAGGLSSLGAGEASDGLVRITHATTRGRVGRRFVPSPQAFVHRSHSGYYGIVNSEEGFQNLVRFLFGDVRADGYLDLDELTLPPAVQQEYDAGKQIRASYLFEAAVSVRGKQWQLHRRTGNDNSAIFRKFDELFPKQGAQEGEWKPDRSRSPLLFNVFLDRNQRADPTRPSLAFALDLCVRVPEYTVAGFLFLKNHFEGDYLFRDLITIEATPPAGPKDAWKIEYAFASRRGEPPGRAELAEEHDGGLTFLIPLAQPRPPGLRATLRVVTRFWNR